MIEPTHRMFTITCALRGEREKHTFIQLFCVHSSAFLFRLLAFFSTAAAAAAEALSPATYSFLATIL